MTSVPGEKGSCTAPPVPTRITVSTPRCESSSSARETFMQPIPEDMTEMGAPPEVSPV